MAASNLIETRHHGMTINRPCWPYQSWSDVSVSETDVEQETSDKTGENDDGSGDGLQLEEPDHWLDDLDDEVSESCPIKGLFDVVNSKIISCTPEAEEIRTEILPVMENTLKSLSTAHKVFQDSYILPVGSMAENSKVSKESDYDFAVLLPALADENIFSWLLRKDLILEESKFSETVADLQCEDHDDVTLNFAKRLKQIWLEEMSKHVTSIFEIQATPCYSDDVSVAGTFHLKRSKDNSIVDLDVCFWVPLDHKILLSAPDDVEQKEYLLEHCLDEHGLVYAILPRDESIDFSLNSIRFATSFLEKQTLLQYGPENNRLRCYRLCKCLVSRLVPKFKKRQDCPYCYESLISSFCLKNVVLYLIDIYKTDTFWTEEQLPNRVVEVFAILSLCMKVNFHRVSAFFAPYEIQINRTLSFSVDNKCVGKQSSPDGVEKICIIQKLDEITDKLADKASKQALEDYEQFLKTTEWNFAKVICRLTELLAVLRSEDETEREELRQNAGWNEYGL